MSKQDTKTSGKKALSFGRGTILFTRVAFVVASLQFLKEAFHKYDGFSAYISFKDFLPSVSVVFVINSVIIVSLAFVLCSVIYIFYRISARLFISLRFEHLITWLILYFSLLIIFRNFSLAEQLGMSHVLFLIMVIPVTAIVVWLLRKHNEKLLDGIDFRITPLVWLFVFLSVVAVIISMSVVLKSTDALNSGTQEQITTGNINRPNIVLVSMDALTALDMQLYGYRRPTTPFISEWSKDALVFNKFYAASNWTTPAAMSMMTGQRPWTHKVWYRAFFNPVSKYEKNLPSVLKNNGYGVYNFIQNPYANPHTLGMEDSFDMKNRAYSFGVQADMWYELFENMPVVGDWVSSLPLINMLTALSFPNNVTTTLTPPELIYNRFLDYISEREQTENNKQPFFAWLHVLSPHKWYLPPKPYMGLFGDADRFNKNTDQLIDHEYPPEKQADIDILRKRYDEFILYSDKQFEIFLQHLSEKIDMTNTIIILSADHGESFSHGYFEHAGQHLYEPLVHIPLVIKMLDRKAGKRIDVPVEQIDLAPTILELAGIDAPGWMEGRSLLPLTDGRTFEQRPVFSMQLNKNPSFGQPIQKGTVALWEADYKLIYYLGKKEVLLFNLKDDPGESTNLKDEKPDVTQRLLDVIKKNISQANKRITQSQD